VSIHRCAVVIASDHGGVVPDRLDALLALPGLGPYTARAVLAFAHERDVGVVDTNVGRVLARQHGVPHPPARAQRLADELVPAGGGWAWNQAMLDLGALVCTRRTPRCEECPVAATCSWAAAGRSEPDPAVGSAGVSRTQSRFEGSFRQGRARLLDVVRRGAPVAPTEFVVACGWDARPGAEEDARRAAASLRRDGLVAVRADGSLVLP